ncbi:MAG: NAD(P)-dependent oxidoreductase [Terrimicrobiaceae bacterium]|nr:NAD(P)-dependent oxidoreductase [Terrimicrobiaceae bacterium]
MKTLFLTGATGFVGRNLLIRAVQNSWRVLAPVRDPAKLDAQLDAEKIDRSLVEALSTDPTKWPSVRADLAVLSAGILFARNRDEYFRTNVDWTLAVLSALPTDTRTVLLSSQSAGGPTPSGLAARNEATPDAPLTWYGESKLALEQAVRRLPDRRVTILRPPMILGARDTATLPLFQMARGWIRTKPGLRPKEFSFISVDDMVTAILAAAETDEPGPFYVASRRTITDLDLIETAARVAGANGHTLHIPQLLVRVLSAVVDAVPALRRATPSLTRDRAREIWPGRWVVDGRSFEQACGFVASDSLENALRGAFRHYVAGGQLPARQSASGVIASPT